MNEKKIVTAKDIAKVCGISQATVSYVINNKEGKKISQKTRQLVLETAKALDYIPNSSAKAMRTNKVMSIGVVSGKNCINIGFNHVLRGVKKYADQMGYSITLLNDDETSEQRGSDYVTYFRANKVDGLLFIFYDMSEETLEILENYQIPYLMINEKGVGGKEKITENLFEKVVEECVEVCKRKGWKKIQFISTSHGGKLRGYKYQLFEESIEKGFQEARLKRLICEGKDDQIIEQIERCILAEEIDIIITPHQRLGILTQSAILRSHFVLPQYIKHVCLGDSKVFRTMYPTVTSIKIPLEDMGHYGAEVLHCMIQGKDYEEQTFECVLEYGMSTD